MPGAPFGNSPEKIDKYRAFWKLEDVRRPLVGFSFASWFPLGEFSACKAWGSSRYLTPEMIAPQAFLDDHISMLREGDTVEDDILRGACPTQVGVLFLPGMLGGQVRLLPENCLGEERNLPWEEALQVRLNRQSPWFKVYIEFLQALVAASEGRFPVSHAPDLGPTDLHAVLRGHTQSIIDLFDEPEKSAQLLSNMGEVMREYFEESWKRIPQFHGGYFDAQYSLWSRGPIIRIQEDATAVYSPQLFRKLVQRVDRKLASHFASAFIHLHSTSMFLLEAFLEIEEIRCYEINNDACGPPIKEMVPYFQRVQKAKRPLLIRGSFSPEEIRVLLDSLEPRGLYLLMMVKSMEEVEALRPILKM